MLSHPVFGSPAVSLMVYVLSVVFDVFVNVEFFWFGLGSLVNVMCFDVVDFGSFVSKRAIPQMSDSSYIIDNLDLSNTKSKLLLPTKALDLQILSRLGSGTDPQLKIAVDYGLRDDITIGASNSNYLNTLDFYLRTNYLNKLFDKDRYPINFIYNSGYFY